MSVKTRVRTTPVAVMGDTEIQHQRHRARRIRKVSRYLDVPRMLTPTFNDLSRFCFMGCAIEVSNLFNCPIVNLLGTRVDGTRAKVVA